VGALCLVPTSRYLPAWGGVFLAPIAATAVFVLTGLVLSAGGIFSVVLTVGLSSAFGVLALVGAMWRFRVDVRWVLQVLGGSVLIAAVVAAVSWRFPTVRFSTDSFHYLMSAAALVETGTLEGVADIFLLKRQLSTPLLHTLGVETGRGYVSFWTPLLAVSTFGSMAWFALDGLRSLGVSTRLRWTIVVPTVAFALTANRVLFHVFYVNGHMLFASLLLGAVGLGWLAVRNRSWILLVPSSVMFAAIVPLRAESKLVVGAFLVAFLSATVVPLRWRWALLGPSLAAVAVWDGWMLPRLLEDPSFESMEAPMSEIVVALALVALVVLSGIDRSGRLERFAPTFMIVTLVVVLAGFVLTDPPLIVETIRGTATAMTVTGYWSTFWLISIPLFVVAAVIGFVQDRFIVPGIVAFAVLLPILAYLRGSPFGDHVGDSANRMIMHVAPLVLLSIMMAAGTVTGDSVGRSQKEAQQVSSVGGTVGDA
jgi:hypothetical protein